MTATRIHCYEDVRRIARRRLPWIVFDYIDGSAGTDTGGSTQPRGSWVRIPVVIRQRPSL